MRYRRLAGGITGIAFAFVGMVALPGCDPHNVTGPSGVLSISVLSPATGLTTRTTAVTIQGHGFKAGATVSFGDLKVGVNSVSENMIVATVPMHDPATVDVVVTNPDGQSVTKTGGFAFVFVAAPVVSAVSPSLGSTEGFTSVVVNGDNFKPGLTATLDGVPLNVSINTSATFFVFNAPPHAAGIANIIVRNPDGQDSTEHPFAAQYRWAPPDTFDFTGNWHASFDDGHDNDFPFSFSVDDTNALSSVTCYDGTSMPLPGIVRVSNGRITASANGSVLFSARIVANDQAVGTINVGSCHSSDWVGRKDHTGSTLRRR